MFLFNSRYRAQLDDCAASAVCLSEKDAEDLPHPVLIASRPRLAWARIATLFDGDEQGPGVHPSAVVDPSVELPGDVAIGPNAVVAENVVLGTGVTHRRRGEYWSSLSDWPRDDLACEYDVIPRDSCGG